MTPKTVAATLALAAALSLTAGGGTAHATSQNHKSSKSNMKPLIALSAGDPQACRSAARLLDADGDLRIDAEIFEGRRRLDTAVADRCAEANAALGRYLRARVLAASGRYRDAAAEASGAEQSISPCPGGWGCEHREHIRSFRTDALSDARTR